MCQATDSADSSKRKCFLCSTHQHICDHTTSLDCSEFPVFSCLSKPNHSADGQTNETGQWQHLPLKVLLELEAQWPSLERWCAGREHCSRHQGLCGELQLLLECPSWASCKSNPVAAPKMGSSLEYHLPWEWETPWHWPTHDSLRTSAPQSLWPQASKASLITMSCNQDRCKPPQETYSCYQNCPQLFEASLSPGDNNAGHHERYLWAPQVTAAHPEWHFWEPRHGSFAYVKNMWYKGYVTSLNFFSGSLCFSFRKDKKQLTQFPDIHHILAEGNAPDFVVIWVSQCQSLFLFLYI